MNLNDFVYIILKNDDLLFSIRNFAKPTRYSFVNLGGSLEGNAIDIAKQHAKKLLDLPPETLLLTGGNQMVGLETEISQGTKGRNTEYLPTLFLEWEGRDTLNALAYDIDVLDGTASAA